MNAAAYGQAAVEGFKSIVNAVMGWRSNPLRGEVNRRMWGRWWPLALVLLVAAALAFAALQPVSVLTGLLPPLAFLNFIPGVVRDLVVSAPALFGFVVAWRVRRLRLSGGETWPERAGSADFEGRFFDAGAVPVALATVVLAIGCQVVELLVAPAAGGEITVPGMDAMVELGSVAGASGMGRTILTVALVAGILGVHREVGTGFGKLFGAGFFVWGMHIAIGFTVPWMTSWWSYLPFVGGFAGDRSPILVLLVFDLGVACAAWMAARERCRSAVFWDDEPAPPPPPPPPPAEEKPGAVADEEVGHTDRRSL